MPYKTQNKALLEANNSGISLSFLLKICWQPQATGCKKTPTYFEV